ncbi:MAG: sigma-70 family RNA polymerase sigma factor [Planctomycetes bacterium]|nr:sigma-70 family RNA polymerase sigma factor [Planctomycetota bacterium]
MTNALNHTETRIVDDLVVRARCDRDAFGQLYDLIYPPVFRYCVRRTGDRSLAEDITSTVFLSVAHKIAAFPGETFQDFRRWVFAIATNEMKATFRKSARRRALLIDAVQAGRLTGKTSGDSSSSALEADSVQAAIMRLPERDQTIITLRFFSELPYDDIGRILNISPGAARTAATRALDKIRKEIGRE